MLNIVHKKRRKKFKILGLLPIDEGAGESEDPGDGVDGELVGLLGNAVVDLPVDAAVRVLGPYPGTSADITGLELTVIEKPKLTCSCYVMGDG